MTLEMFDQIEVDESHAEEIPMPHIQWFNGKGKAYAKLNPVIANGGFELPFDAFGNILTDTYEIVEVPHGDGEELSYLLPSLHIAILAKRFRWERNEMGRMVGSQRYEAGATGRYQYFCLIKELAQPIPVILTFKGMVGKAFSKTSSDHLKTVIGKLRQLRNVEYPQYTLWLPVVAGPSEKAGKDKDKQHDITPPVGFWNTEALAGTSKTAEAALGELFIGAEYFNEAKRLRPEADEWSKGFQDETPAPVPSVVSASGDLDALLWNFVKANNIDKELADAIYRQSGDDPVATLAALQSQGESIVPPSIDKAFDKHISNAVRDLDGDMREALSSDD